MAQRTKSAGDGKASDSASQTGPQGFPSQEGGLSLVRVEAQAETIFDQWAAKGAAERQAAVPAEDASDKAVLNAHELFVVQTLTQMVEAALKMPGADEINMDAAGLLFAAQDWLSSRHWENGDKSFHNAESSLLGALALDEKHSPDSTDRHTLIRQIAEFAGVIALGYSASLEDGYESAVCIRAGLALSRIQASSANEASYG